MKRICDYCNELKADVSPIEDAIMGGSFKICDDCFKKMREDNPAPGQMPFGKLKLVRV